jgi:hypothetical protein
MDPRVEEVLKRAGYLSAEQLSRHFKLELDQVPLEPWMARTATGLWNNAVHSKGSHLRHWELITEIYLSLQEILMDWNAAKPSGPGPRPDAILAVSWGGWAIALEADTGSENRRLWDVKLERYRLSPQEWHLLVVTTGKAVRQRRLRDWLKESSPVPWLLLDLAHLTDPHAWEWTAPKRELPLPFEPRCTEYQLNGVPLPQETAERGLSDGRLKIAWRERLCALDRIELRESRQLRILWLLAPKFFVKSAGIPSTHREITDKLSVRNGGTHDGDQR